MSLYLSKITLSPLSRLVLRDLASPYEMHRTIMRAFPYKADGGPGRILFRLEPSRDGQPPVVLVQSEKQPDWKHLRALDGYLLDVAVKPWQPALREGQKLRFRLRANPTVKRQLDGKPKRIGLVKEEDQMRWLGRKAAAVGCRTVGVVACRQTRLVSRKEDTTGATIYPVHLGVDFEGVLEVADPAAFAEAIAGGVGSAKGYGFGLLSIAPL